MESIHIPRFHTDPITRLSVLPSHLTPTTRRQYRGNSGLTVRASSSLGKNRQAPNIDEGTLLKETVVPRRNMMVVMMSSLVLSQLDSSLSGNNQVMAETSTAGMFKEHMDTFDGYSFFYPKNWVQVRGSGADIFFRDSFVLDENLSVEISSPSSSDYKSVEDLGLPKMAGERVQKQNLIEFMSTRLGVRRESNILSTSSRVADDGKLYYDVEVCFARLTNFLFFFSLLKINHFFIQIKRGC